MYRLYPLTHHGLTAMITHEIKLGEEIKKRNRKRAGGKLCLLLQLMGYDTDAYRTVIAVQLGRKIYILHAFQKKSKKGIATPKHDTDLIKKRYMEARELAKNE